MTDPARPAGTEGARHLLSRSEAALTDLLSGLMDVSEKLALKDGISGRELAEVIATLGAIRRLLIHEVDSDCLLYTSPSPRDS